MKPLILKLARALDRTDSDRQNLTDLRAARVKGMLFLGLILGASAVYVPILAQSALHWWRLKPELPIDHDSSWRAYYGSGGHCPPFATASRDCPANLDNPQLWQSPIGRFDGSHEKWIQARRGRDFWVGVTLPPQAAAQAAAGGANHFLLGHIWSPYRVWVDGEYVTDGAGAADEPPIFLTFASDKLRSGKPIRIAVQVMHDSDFATPDHFCKSLRAGFVTRATANHYVSMAWFWENTRPLALLAAYSIIAGLFFFFWLLSRMRQEHFYLASFALVSAALQARSASMLNWGFERATNLAIDVVLGAYLAGFAMFLGFSFARLRRGIFQVGVPVLIALPAFMLLAYPGAHGRFLIREAIDAWGFPAGCLAGAVACLLQGQYLAETVGAAARSRIRRLRAFGLCLLGLATIQALRHAQLLPYAAIWRGFEHLTLLMGLVAVALGEYGDAERRPLTARLSRPARAAGGRRAA